MTARQRVFVVGAGLSGLTAAYRLDRAGIDVAVLEARDRVGGRAWRVPVGNTSFDAGCEVLDREHTALRGLAEEIGVGVWEGPRWSDRPPGLDGADLAAFEDFQRELEALVARVDPCHPEDTDGAGSLDAQSVAGWLEEMGAPPRVLEAAEAQIAIASSTVSTREMSLLAYAAKLASGAAPTGLTLRFDGGPAALAQRLAEALDGRIRLGAPVAGLEDDGNEVLARLRDGTTEAAPRAIVAVPLTVQREMRFRPALPAPRRTALEEARYGVVVKEAALFDSSAPLPSRDLSSNGHLYVSPEDDRLLIRFAGAAAADCEVDIGRLVGVEPEARAAVNWSHEEWTCGSYLILGPRHLLTWAGRLGDAHGRIHFAGAERSTLRSYMEGAVRAGNDVADEILAAAAG
jgi:monoamine oxidase